LPDGASAPTHILYEAPHRILESLEDVLAVFGPSQRIVLARELTKLHEQFLRGTVEEVRQELRSRPVVRGEIVLLLSGAQENVTPAGLVEVSLADEVAALMSSERVTEMEAIKRVAKARGVGKSEAYREWQRTRPR